MKTFTERLYHAMENEFYELTTRTVSECEKLRVAIRICKKAMIILKKYISCISFECLDDEIHFFKEIKPLFYSKYIYYISVYQFHLRKPTGTEDDLKAYITMQLSDIKRFFDHNQSFYQYYRANSSNQDEVYFTRNSYEIQGDAEDFHGDDMFSTSHDYKLSKIIANEKFREYLMQQLDRPNKGYEETPVTPIIWTCNQTDLVELIYALVESGAFNNGNIEIKYLMDYFQNIFHVDLKYYYRKYTDITNRKKERTVFLDRLKLCLIRRMESKYEY